MFMLGLQHASHPTPHRPLLPGLPTRVYEDRRGQRAEVSNGLERAPAATLDPVPTNSAGVGQSTTRHASTSLRLYLFTCDRKVDQGRSCLWRELQQASDQ
jgi:hypothetical protein